MHTCNECASYGLGFCRPYEPHEFIEGSRNAQIWVIGLNPAEDPRFEDKRSVDELVGYFDGDKVHRYFKQFKTVSERLYGLFGKNGGAAHTDLVKCFTKRWPPAGASAKDGRAIIASCTKHLERQLAEYSPKIIICNGREVSATMKRLLPPPGGTPANVTNYVHEASDGRIGVVLSGFIGRIDNYAKRRLGLEVENFLDNMLDER